MSHSGEENWIVFTRLLWAGVLIVLICYFVITVLFIGPLHESNLLPTKEARVPNGLPDFGINPILNVVVVSYVLPTNQVGGGYTPD